MRNNEPANGLSAVQAAKEIREGHLSSVALVAACLRRIEETDEALKAWAYVDADAAMSRAEEMDRIRKAGRAVGPLHGVPVGLKDIIDTRSMPTERGTPIFAGRQPETDACIVQRLFEAGAVIIGKTKTTELAFVHPTDTRNPHNLNHSPGGSSSGSAAAVAAFQVPLAIGTQTNGSVIRPASYCGVYGFKPTRGIISRTGILQTSVTLDQVGCFGRTLEDVAMLADAIGSFDQADAASLPRPRPAMLEGAKTEAPVEPLIAWFDFPFNDRLSNDSVEAMEMVIETLGGKVERMGVAPQLSGLVDVQATIHQYEICQHLAEVFDHNWDQISATLQPIIESGRRISLAQYEDALEVMASAENFFAQFFIDYDAVLAPSATGVAPVYGAGTGDPIFSTIWTLAGLPTVTLPLLVGDSGLPIGVQLIGSSETDDRLMRTAAWVEKKLQATI